MKFNDITNINFFKKIIVKILLLTIIFSQNVFSKPIPPGSGEGDVPANILILLDSSDSMGVNILTGAAMHTPEDIIEDNDGNLIVSQWNRGLIKLNYSDATRDMGFADVGVFMGADPINSQNLSTANLGTCVGKDSRADGADRMAYDSTNDIVYVITRGGHATNHPDYEAFDPVDKGGKAPKIVSLTSDGVCVDVIEWDDLTFTPYVIAIRQIDSEEHMFVIGRDNLAADYTQGKMYSKNITTGDVTMCPGLESKYFSTIANKIADIDVTSDGSYLYMAWKGWIFRYAMTKSASENTYCPTTDGSGDADAVKGTNNKVYTNVYKRGLGKSGFESASSIALDPDDDTKIYVADIADDGVKKFTIGSDVVGGDHDFTLVKAKGDSTDKENTTSDSKIYLRDPISIYAGVKNKSAGGNNVVYVGDKISTIEVFDRSLANLTWQKELGGPKVTRLDGAIKAIKSIVGDSTLTSGAHFGFGHWNSGTAITDPPGGANSATLMEGEWEEQCHRNGRVVCTYYQGWDGEHPDGRSVLCTKDSCLMTGVSREGYSKIAEDLDGIITEWGTDGRAFSQLAYKYFTDPNASPIDPHSSCQLNYVVVIGDGAWTNHDVTKELIEKLRIEKGVKTLVVAYGNGISESGLSNFHDMAIAGSCDDPTGEAKDCQKTILAATPQDLKTALTSKIQQIIAERLAFTAPSITATIQEGGGLYQAQFDYVQYGEWEGTIRKRQIKADGTIDYHSTENWSASEKIYNQSKRRIWTVMPEGVIDSEYNYLGNWNNFTVANSEGIQNLFELTGNSILDYHKVSANSDGSLVNARCSTADVTTSGTAVADGNEDDIKGLISFMRGYDFFDYKGDCELTEKRLNMLGDVYHSQLVEVGRPKANTNFTNNNQESYWRSINNYQSFSKEHETRQKIIYAGANDGMLHAINSDTGEEEWAFVPPLIAAKIPTIMNVDLNGKVGTHDGGGSNAIFGVDGSPVIHDMYYRGRGPDGTLDASKKWHTIMIIPYGRGGAGFSVLDVTHPIIESGKGPVHLISVYNDTVNHRVWFVDHEGVRSAFDYLGTSFQLSHSLEAETARENERVAANNDPSTIDDIYTCQTNTDSGGSFISSGTNSCYKGRIWSFNPGTSRIFETADLKITQSLGTGDVELNPNTDFTVDTSCSTSLCINFTKDKFFTASRSESSTAESSRINIKIINDDKAGVIMSKYDYSKLGETWSTPRVFRLPNDGAGDFDINDDIYTVILPGGMGVSGIGSTVYLIDLEDIDTIPGSESTSGHTGKIIKKIKIEDTSLGDGDIANAIPSSPVVITPDIGHGITWTGALAYIGDLEGKITKINLTNIEDSTFDIYDQTTLFSLNSSVENGRYLYHMMDAGIGHDTRQLWLFGGTGNFADINSASAGMDNILFGVRDFDYPNYAPVSSPGNADDDDESGSCVNTSTIGAAADCPVTPSDSAWIYHLDNTNTGYMNRKASAPPTVYRGNVYFPVYKPFPGLDKCNLGSAYICSADDECGINNSDKIPEYVAPEVEGDACMFIRRGILSELVIFGDTLYGNVAGPSEDAETLVSILASFGELDTYRGSWRENY